MNFRTRFSPRRLYLGMTLAALMAATTQAQVIVNDSWVDGDLASTGSLDSDWWTSSSSSGIELVPGGGADSTLGLVTGTSGRGVHTIFPTQTLSNVGDMLVATYTFTTPASVAPAQDGAKSAAFRVGLFDNLGRDTTPAVAGGDTLAQNVSASSGTPNAIYGLASAGIDGLPGYLMDMDVGTTEEDINFRKHNTDSATGRLMSTTGSGSFSSVGSSGPDGAYSFAANTTYTGSFKVTRSSATEFDLTGTMDGATHTVTDTFDSDSFGMLAFHVNSRTFGSTSSQGEVDNGLMFSNISVEFVPVPEPGGLVLLLSSVVALAFGRKRR